MTWRLIRHSYSQKRSAKEARKEASDCLIGSYGSLGSRKERRKGASEDSTTVRYSKILMLAVDGVPAERLIEKNEVMELVFPDICGQRVYLLQ